MEIYKNVFEDGRYELVLKNECNQVFDIHYGGADLYWSMSDYCEDNEFVVTPLDGLFYIQLEEVFEKIYKCDEPYNRLFFDNCFVWFSEAYGIPEEAHKLLITKNDNCFCIRFVRNQYNFSPSNTCFISFCLSGSRNQEIANAFSMMLLEYRNYDSGRINKKVLKI